MKRPGWQTTEFWLQAIPMAGVFVLLALGRVTVEDVGRLWPIFVSIHGGGGLYAIGRSMVKG